MNTSISLWKETGAERKQKTPADPKGKRLNLIPFLQRHGEMAAALLCGVLVFTAWVMEERFPAVAVPLFLIAYVSGGYVKAKEGITTLLKEKELDVNLLMFLAAIGAAGIGYWMEGGMLIFIFSLSGALESYTLAKSERDLSSLMEMKPETARLYSETGEERLVAISELQAGNLVIVKPGERIPADGFVTEGISSVDQATITGEPLPADKSPGDEVYAGTMNGSGSLIVEVTRAGENSLFSKIIQMIEAARTKVPKTQQRIERLEKSYAKWILGLTLLIMVLPHFFLGWSWQESLYRAMVFLVVASPCALVASTMPVILSAISNGARKGILFKSGVQLEALAGIQVVAFDKTGTLTEGRPQVTDWITFGGFSEKKLLQAAGSIETFSEHPIARAIVQQAKQLNLSLYHPSQLQAITGWGVEATYGGERWKIGKPGLFKGLDNHLIQSEIKKREQEGKTVVLVEKAGAIVGLIALRDTIRPEARRTVLQLRKMGIQVAMLTGDQCMTAEAIAREAGIELVYSQLLPEDKVKVIEQLGQTKGKVAMIGDGVNDAPALATAEIGIAMGGAGSDVALETADVVLMNDDLDKIPHSIQLGKRMGAVVKQNICFALSVILLLIIANFSQMVSLPFGVVGHEGSTILVILNGLRLLR
ncbi:heavy metal translocating P-type ATPase [Paenactinomyces guangxiensis]|uniref:Heavy metal translocating P-type ATPase n=1 Tax=Paenactinomyces guangxiensis TaxID=1490290 RepID=A0A7W1WP21_9BACL|nr:heavy metal translocating P-type ATPase [Paenactinomyces guangxiensis]MBA4493380.1 heavy metal translocating P-type ATPase [Paenactinomyces guangxiensis]MBH8590470.1 heavy metal translocating P-type ATPase [Paenactinomyces guangxiensis]